VVVLAVAEGDIHDIGKNLVKIMLDSAGFKVIDLGKDVPVAKVVKAVADNNAQVLGLSALMTTTMTGMKKVIEQLNASGFKGKVKVMIGGAPTSEAFAEQIGADAWAKDASQSVGLVKKLTA
jgi:methylmalonyl-CoA mutase cobalamin-binding domain/chain